MKTVLSFLFILAMPICMQAQDSTYKKYYASAAVRLNVMPNLLPVGLEGALNFGLSPKLYLGLNVGTDMATRKASMTYINYTYPVPPGAKTRVSFYSIGLDAQYKRQITENSLVLNCVGGIEIIESGYIKKNTSTATGRYVKQNTNSFVFIRPGFRYYFMDRVGVGVQYAFLVGSPQFGERKYFQRFQFVASLKTNQQQPRKIRIM